MEPSSLSGRYRLERLLGQGGMGTVHLAHDEMLGRRVAIKFLAEAAEADATARERFRREALSAAALDHPFICKIHDVGDANGHSYIVMEFVDGQTLHAAAREAALPVRQILDIAIELSEALEVAHGRALVHRDLKPSNVMLTPQGHVKVMDFGLAKPFVVAPSQGGEATIAAATDLTDPGVRVGTPAYMAPEQILGAPADPRSDIFSVGVVLWELVTGVHPFIRDNAGDTMAAVLRDEPRIGPRDPDAVPGLAALLRSMLAKACAERPQDASQLAAALRAIRERAMVSTTPSSSTSPLEPSPQFRAPFVSRDTEMSDLRRALDRMLLGHGGFVLLGGEPGVGKTRLVSELQREAQNRGCLCVVGHCYEMEGAPPYVPFVEVTEDAARRLPQAVRTALGDGASDIAGMIPGLRRIYPDIPEPPPVAADQQRRVQFTAFLEYLRRSTAKSAMVVLLDDLHWADDPTLQLLLFVAPHLGSMRVLVLGTYRDVELDVQKPFAKTLEALLRQRLASRIALRRLTAGGVEQMLATMGGSAPPSGLVRAVFAETDGNPFFVEEVFLHLKEEGRLFDTSGAWRPDLRVDTLDVPEGVRLVIGRRLERLGETPRRILTAAAVIGRSFSLDLLQAIVDLPEDPVLDALEQAEAAHLLTSDPRARTPTYAFVHELIRSTLAAGLSLPRRQRMHLRIADAVEKLRASSLESHASILAHHLYQAGAAADAGRTAAYLLIAARRAVQSSAFEEALVAIEQVAGLDAPLTDQMQVEVGELEGSALLGLHKVDPAVAVLQRTLDRAQSIRDDAGIERIANLLGFVLMWMARGREALTIAEHALAVLPESARPARARATATMASNLATIGRIEAASARAAEARALAEGVDDPTTRAIVANADVIIARAKGDADELARTTAATLPLARAASSVPLLLPDVYWQSAIAAYYAGKFDDVERITVEGRPIAERTGHHGALWAYRRFEKGIALSRTGDLRGFIDASRHDEGERFSWPFLIPAQIAYMQFCLGEIDQSVAAFERLMETQPAEHMYQPLIQASLFSALVLAGQDERARRVYSDLRDRLPLAAEHASHGQMHALGVAAQALTLLGEREECSRFHATAVALLDCHYEVDNLAVGPYSPHLAAGFTAMAAGRSDARQHFEKAVRRAAEIPHRLLHPWAQYWLASWLIEHGEASEQTRAATLAGEALGAFRSLHMPIHAGWVERLLDGERTGS